MRRDGEVLQTGKMRGSIADALAGGRVLGKRVTTTADGERTFTIPADEHAALLRGSNPGPTRRDGVRVVGRLVGGQPVVCRFNRLRELRERAGLSMDELATAAFVPATALRRYEDREEGLDIPGAARDNLAAALDLAVDDVFPERRAGVKASDGWSGLPSLDPTPPPPVSTRPADQTALGEAADRRLAEVMSEAREARDNEQLESARSQLRELRQKLVGAGLRVRAAAIDRKIDAI